MMALIIISILAVGGLICFFIWKGRLIARLRNRRDEIDFSTPEGKWLIRAYNYKIDKLNGYKVFKRTRNK